MDEDHSVFSTYTPERLLVLAVRNCALPAGKRNIGAMPRWAVVARLTTMGSTYAAQLCRWAGTDPDELVVRRRG